MPVHNVGHIVVAHFCQFEHILDDKPAHGVDDDADYDDDGGGDGGDHDESIVESAEFVQFFFAPICFPKLSNPSPLTKVLSSP